MALPSRSIEESRPAPETPDRGVSRPDPIAAEVLDRRLRVLNLCVAGLLLIALFFTFYYARDFLLPVVLAVLLSFPLAPVVRAFSRAGLAESVGSALVILVFLVGISYVGYRVYTPAKDWMVRLPTQFREMETKLSELRKPVEEVSQAAKQVERQVEEMTATEEESPVAVVVDRPALSDVVFSGTWRVVAMGLLTMVLLYFLLASGDLFLLKVVRVLPRLEDKKKAVEISREVEQNISSYLFTVTAINAGLGVAVGAAMYLLQMPNAFLWGVMAAVLNFVPYLGAIAGVAVLSLAALVTFDTLAHAIAVPLVYYLLTLAEGWFVTPLVLGRRLTLNPLMIFVSLIFWAWLWGIPGALLAVPILAAFKIFCDHIERLSPVGEFLGR